MKLIVSSLLLALVVNFVLGILVPNLVSSIVATLLYGVAIAVMFLADPVAVWLLLPFILLQLSVLVSLNFIEGGSYLVEMGQRGHASTAAVTYCMYSLLFLCVVLLARKAIRYWLQKVRSKSSSRVPAAVATVSPLFHYAFLAFAVVCVLYLLFAGLRTGFPLLTHTDRFVYRRLYADIITINILDLKILPPLGLGIAVLAAPTRLLRSAYNICFVLLVVESLLFGDKFFIISLTIVVYLTPLITQDPAAAVRRVIRFVPIFVVGLGVMLATTYLIYSDYGKRTFDSTVERIGDRVSGQGQLWFMAVDDSPSFIKLDREGLTENFVSLFQRDPNDYLFRHNLAPYYFMHKYSPDRIYGAIIHSQGSVTPTMVLEGYGLVLFGYIGLVVLMSGCGVLLALLLMYIQSAVKYGNPFLAIIPALLLNNATKFFAQGTFFSIISQPVVKVLGAFLVLDIFIRLIGLGLNRSQLISLKSDPRVSLRNPADMNPPSTRTMGPRRLSALEP